MKKYKKTSIKKKKKKHKSFNIISFVKDRMKKLDGKCEYCHQEVASTRKIEGITTCSEICGSYALMKNLRNLIKSGNEFPTFEFEGQGWKWSKEKLQCLAEDNMDFLDRNEFVLGIFGYK